MSQSVSPNAEPVLPVDDPRDDSKTPTSGSGEPVVQVTEPPKGGGDNDQT